MYIYNVTVKVDTGRADEWLTWMRNIHIPDVLQTGYFSEYRISRLINEGDLDGITFVIQYAFQQLDDYLNYQLHAAPALQRQHQEKFGQDAVAFRTIMEIL
jgi:hypothetical protein